MAKNTDNISCLVPLQWYCIHVIQALETMKLRNANLQRLQYSMTGCDMDIQAISELMALQYGNTGHINLTYQTQWK